MDQLFPCPRELRVKGKPIELESKPLDILLQLLLDSGEVVTKEELLEAWLRDAPIARGKPADLRPDT
jgi:DNA-binding winged helix-turn-helix (wHTH) protein